MVLHHRCSVIFTILVNESDTPNPWAVMEKSSMLLVLKEVLSFCRKTFLNSRLRAQFVEAAALQCTMLTEVRVNIQ